jgi:pimeloyl-ACP methyl ester carboxylesterase
MKRLAVCVPIVVSMVILPTLLADAQGWRSVLLGQGPAPDAPRGLQSIRAYDGRTMPARPMEIAVPQRHGSQSGPMMTVSALVLPTTAPQPGRPIVFLMGGPGIPGSVMIPIPPYFTLFERLRAQADVLVLDQRGIGGSDPVLDCRFGGDLAPDAFVDRHALVASIAREVRTCAQSWRERGYDPAAFNTLESADDIEALRRVLGVDRIDLLAFSYGTRLALAYLDRHGDHVGRMVLQGVNGPDLVIKRPSAVARKLDAVGRLLQDQPSWTGPTDLLARGRAARARLAQTPTAVTVGSPGTGMTTFDVGRDGLDALVALNLDNPRLPALLASTAVADDRLLARFVDAAVASLTTSPVGLMARAVNCAADRSAERWAAAARDAETAPFGMPIDNAFLTDEFCAAIGASPRRAEFAGAVRSSVPVLLITGTLDATNPAENARAIAATLPNATLLDVENAAHEALPVPAVQDVVVDFLRGEDVGGRSLTSAVPVFPTVDEALLPPAGRGR